jgi:large subunit ribosomal protein L9
MRIVLRADVDNVGKKGDIIDVADGFARNFLLPKGHAIRATEGVEAQAGAMRRSRDLKDAKDREAGETIARKLVPMVIKLQARAGGEGKLFGSITTQDIVAAVAEQAGVELDRRKVHLDEPIRTVGTRMVTVEVSDGVLANVKTMVVEQ